MPAATVLLDIGGEAFAHQSAVDEVRHQLGITHHYFDCWIFGFLENKNFNVAEAVAKLRRRSEFERTELSSYSVTDWMMENMQRGIIQVIGNDKAGRVTFYVCTARDRPTAAFREESRRNFDMFISYGTRLREETKRCQMALLVNQDKASMWSNMDMSFQADIALRIVKYYPGCVDRMYICKMNRTLSALAKPVFSRLPSMVSDRIMILSEGDIKGGKLLELFDENVLPVALGGKNDCDKPENYTRFAYTIKDYFEQMRAAIKRGTSVKEWELDNLHDSGYSPTRLGVTELEHGVGSALFVEQSVISQLPPARGSCSSQANGGFFWSQASRVTSTELGKVGPGFNSDAESDAGLATCDTLSPVLPLQEQVPALRVDDIYLGPPRDLFTDYVDQFTTLETFFRLSIMEMHQREWVQLVQKEVHDREGITDREGHIRGESFFQSMPPPLQIIFKGFVWLCLMVMSVYFFMATLSVATFGSCTLVYFLFSVPAYPYAIFPYGGAFIITAGQLVTYCSRGVDVTRDVFNGRLIHGFRAFGTKALLIQAIVCFICTLSYFIVFCVIASRGDMLTGLQYSVSIGLVVAVCIILVHHLFYAFGIKQLSKTSYRRGGHLNNAEATVYLFMDVDLDDDTTYYHTKTEVVLLCCPALVSFVTGVIYINVESIILLCVAIVALTALVALSTMFLSMNDAGALYTLTHSVILYACLAWINIVFTMSAYGWNRVWYGSLLTTLFTMLAFLSICVCIVRGPWNGHARRWMLRTVVIIGLLHMLGCMISLCVDYYPLGTVMLVFVIHLIVCFFRTTDATNVLACMTIFIGLMCLVLVCCLLGKFASEEIYDKPASTQLLPHYHTDYGHASALPSYNDDFLTPLCLKRFADESLGIVGMSLFAKLGYAASPVTRSADLGRWFPDFREVYMGGTDNISGVVLTAFRKEGPLHNITVLTMRPSSETYLAMEAMTMWIGLYVVSVFRFFIPEAFLENILTAFTYVASVCPLRSLITAVYEWEKWKVFQSVLNKGNNEFIYIVGHGSTGSLMGTVALNSSKNVTGVLFSSPQIVHRKHGSFTESQLASRLMMVTTQQTIVSMSALKTATENVIPCELSSRECDRIDTTVSELDALCSGRR